MFSAVSRDQYLDRRPTSRVMEEPASVLLVEEENFGWTVISTVSDGDLEVAGRTSEETELHARESTAKPKRASKEDASKSEAEQPETDAWSEVGKEGLQTTKRQIEGSEKGETEFAVKAGKVGEEDDYTQEEEEEGEETWKEVQEGEENEEENGENAGREQGKAYQQRFFAAEEAFCTDLMTILSSTEEELRDLKPSPGRKAVVQHQEQKPQAGLLWRVSLMATLGILGWAVLCGGGLKLHFCSMKESEPVLSSHLEK